MVVAADIVEVAAVGTVDLELGLVVAEIVVVDAVGIVVVAGIAAVVGIAVAVDHTVVGTAVDDTVDFAKRVI